MAVAYDVAGAGSDGTTGSMSWTHSASSSTNSAVIAFVSWSGTGFGLCTATYNSVQMRLLASLPFNNSGATTQLMVFGLMNPPTGSQTVASTVTATTTTRFKGNTISFTGVGWIGGAVTAYGTTGTTMSMSATSFKGMIAQIFANSDTTAITGYSGGTALSYNSDSANETVYGYANGSDTPTTISATQTNNIPWAGIAVPIRSTDVINGKYSEINYSGTFSVPARAVGCYVTLIGGGGGGGAGATRTGTGGVNGRGGGGGGGGAYLRRVYVPATSFGSTYTVTIGTGGAGAASSGSDGSAGTASSFTTNGGVVTISAGGGSQGISGQTTAAGGNGGVASTGVFSAEITPETGGAGGTGSTTSTTAATAGASTTHSGAGGGGGGGNIGGANPASGSGGSSSTAVLGSSNGGATSANGTAGVGGVPIGEGGSGGGGGGGGNGSGSGGIGGTGSIAGSGGGGGGGKEGSYFGDGGAGGAGAAGYTKIEWLLGDNNFMNFFPM